MKLDINITPQDIENLRSVVSANSHRVFVTTRIARNVHGKVPISSREDLWRAISMCLLTSQQRSSPGSPVSRFLLETPFRLSLEACSKTNDVEAFIQNELTAFGGIRFASKVSTQMFYNLDYLNYGGWSYLEEFLHVLTIQRKQSPILQHYQLEREAANFAQRAFHGLGPKQSRNFWQSLGLTRYEFVLDSRVQKWLRGMGFPLPLTSSALGEEDYYCFISDIMRDWCLQADVLPCILDACILSSYDAQDWPENAILW